MRWPSGLVVTLALMGGVGLASSAAQTRSGMTSDPSGGPKVVPWLELGPGPEAMEQAAHGLLLWRIVAEAAIISGGPEDAARLRRLHERIEGIRIIPGLKTSPILVPAGFDSVAGWQKIARAVRALCAATGEKIIVFEHEGALASYIDGKQRIDWDRLRAGLRQLPAECEILWYPSAAMDGEILARYVRLCEVVSELPNVRFIDHASFYSPKGFGQPGTLNAVARLEAAARRPPVPLIYCCGPEYWPYDRIPEALGKIHRDMAIVYPGAARWVEAGRALSRILPARSPQSRPTSQPTAP